MSGRAGIRGRSSVPPLASGHARNPRQTPVLHSIAAILRLSRPQLQLHPRIQLRSEVSFYSAVGEPYQTHPTLFVSEAGHGLYVDIFKPISGLRYGDMVTITGWVRPGFVLPVIMPVTIQVVGHSGREQPAIAVPLRQMRGPRPNARWVSVEGVVRRVRPYADGTMVDIAEGAYRVHIHVTGTGSLTSLLDRLVRVRGVAGLFFTLGGQRIQAYMDVPGPEFFTALEPSRGDPFKLPVQRVSALAMYAGARYPHRVHVRGVVTLQMPRGETVIQDASGPGQVLDGRASGVPPCSLVDVVGFPQVDARGLLQLSEGRIRYLRPASCPPAIVLRPGSGPGPLRQNRRIAVTGQLASISMVSGAPARALILRSGAYYFTVPLGFRNASHLASRLRPGSQLRVTGVFFFSHPAHTLNYELAPAQASDIVVLRQPSWWTTRHLLWIIGVCVLVALLALGWAAILRRQVERQSSQILDRASENARLQESLFESHRRESIVRLAAGIAHDFNNLLTVIVGHLELAMADCGEHQRADLQSAMDAAAGASRLTWQLVTYGRQQVLKAGQLQLQRVLEECLPALRSIAGEMVDLQVNCAPALWTIHADSDHVRHVLYNLVGNAHDAMPEGGRLLLSADNFVLRPEHSGAFSNASAGEYVRLTIEDSGCGMSPEVLKNIFEPFYTTKALGHGLGLASVHGAVVQSGGGIRVRSEIGAGTRFEVLFPQWSDQEATLAQPASAGSN